MGYGIGKSLVEDDMVELASKLMKQAEEKGVKLILPTDVVLADKFDNDANTAIASKLPIRTYCVFLLDKVKLMLLFAARRGERNHGRLDGT